MSHCTKFDFTYSDEGAIVKAFDKLGIKCSTEMVCEFNSNASKMLLGNLGYLGNKQFRAITGSLNGYNIFLCKVSEDKYDFFIERHRNFDSESPEVKELAKRFKRAYVEVAVDGVVKKLDKANMPSEVVAEEDKFVINFGPTLEYSLSIIYNENSITEEVSGIKGEFCTRLTEDIENILSHPTAELSTEWKQEYNMMIEDQNIQVLSLSF
ncbi:MAG: DUF2997 domain-containing protein [Bacteroidaceae bacterium]|nr:DUF2997 domain-containing protein [Bacteroidaceae bacterium]